MATAQRMDPATYERLAVLDEFKRTELWDGVPVEKPSMGHGHGDVMVALVAAIDHQLDFGRARLRVNHARLAIPGGSCYIPDIAILPAAAFGAIGDADLFHEPAMLVAENWSPSTGTYDVNVKFPSYMARGDVELWRVHPLERTVTRWVRMPDGRYEETTIAAGRIELAALPGVGVDLASIFRG